MVLDQVRVPLSGKKMFDTSIHNTFVRRSVTIGFALLLIVVSHAALAVSFDCSKAVYETERAICQSPLLRDLDDTLAAAYGRARVSSSEASTIKDQQVEWVRSSRRCGSDVACLEAAYRLRIAQLGGAPIQPSPAATPPISRATLAIAAGTAPAPDQRLPAQSASVDGVVDEAVAAVHIADRGKVCTTQPAAPNARYAIDGYVLLPEFTQKFGLVTPYRLNKGIDASVEQFVNNAKSEGCAVVVAGRDDIGRLVALLTSNRTWFLALPLKPASESVQALLKREGLERPEHLLLLDALPSSGNSGDVRALLDAGVTSPQQLASLTRRIVESGYSDRIDINIVRGFLTDQREGAITGKSAVQVLKARQTAEAEAEKERSAAELAKRWEQWEGASKRQAAVQVLKARQAAEAEAEKERELAAEAKRAAKLWWDEFVSWAIVVAVVVGIGFVVYLIAGASSACPKCRKWFSAQTLATYELGRRGAYETITRQDQHKNAKGEVIGTTSRQEQVHVTYINYRAHKQCSKCAHQWVAEYTTKV